MTDPAGSPPTPQAPAPPPSGNWQTPPPPAQAPGGFQIAAAEAGPAPGVVYADLTTRIIAAVIDWLALGIVWSVVWSVVAGTLLLTSGFGLLLIAGVAFGILWAGACGVYFVYTWTKMRASLGQKVMKIETVNAADGATLTQSQAIRRWAFLFGLPAAGVVLGNVLGVLGMLVSLLTLGYTIYLLYTVSQSPKRQGFHDLQAGTVVVKRVA